MKWIFPLVVVVIFELSADIFSKEWSLQNKWWLALAGVALYLVSNIFWLFTLKNGAGLGRGVVIFSVASAIIASVLGFVFYGEAINKTQLIGIIFGIISITLIFWE